MTTASSLHPSPSVGFEQPFEMLHACHERVLQRLALLERLAAHLCRHGADTQARDAARDVLRYFDLAAPLHHQDEEHHVLPRLRQRGHGELADRLAHEHAILHAQWLRLRQPLLCVAAGQAMPLDDWQGWSTLYKAHIQLEEGEAFGAARHGVTSEHLTQMGAEMAARRIARHDETR